MLLVGHGFVVVVVVVVASVRTMTRLVGPIVAIIHTSRGRVGRLEYVRTNKGRRMPGGNYVHAASTGVGIGVVDSGSTVGLEGLAVRRRVVVVAIVTVVTVTVVAIQEMVVIDGRRNRRRRLKLVAANVLILVALLLAFLVVFAVRRGGAAAAQKTSSRRVSIDGASVILVRHSVGAVIAVIGGSILMGRKEERLAVLFGRRHVGAFVLQMLHVRICSVILHVVCC